MQYQLSIPVNCVQILFAHLYPVAGNVVLFVVVHTRLLYFALREADDHVSREDKYCQLEKQGQASPRAKKMKEKRDDAQTDLMALLQAAKAANSSKGAL
jgi:hypothetical protein